MLQQQKLQSRAYIVRLKILNKYSISHQCDYKLSFGKVFRLVAIGKPVFSPRRFHSILKRSVQEKLVELR